LDIDGNIIIDTVTTYGSKLYREDPNNCDPSYMVLTVIPKSAQPGTKTFKANFGTYDWKYNLEAPNYSKTLVKNFRSNVEPDYEFYENPEIGSY
jgi:hypothetical protein